MWPICSAVCMRTLASPSRKRLAAPLQSKLAPMTRWRFLHWTVTGQTWQYSFTCAFVSRELRVRLGRSIVASNVKTDNYPQTLHETCARLNDLFATEIASVQDPSIDGAAVWKRAV